MNNLILSMIALSASASAFAFQNYDNIVCKSSAGYSQSYSGTGYVRPYPGGCNPAMECAGKALAVALMAIPEAGQAAHSSFFDEYVEVSKKRTSKPTLEAVTGKMTERSCLGSGDTDMVDCVQATACATISVEYSVCKKITYNPDTGKKIITCPSGRVIRE